MNIRTKKLLSILPIVALLLCSPSYSDSIFTHAVLKVPFEVREKSPWSQTIESQDAWELFYRTNAVVYLGENSKLLSAPSIDFGQYSIVAGGLGSSYSHSSIMIRYVRDQGPYTDLSALILTPGASCNVPSVISYPTVVLLIPKPDDNLKLHVSEVINECR